MRISLGIAAALLVAVTMGASCQKKKREPEPTSTPTTSPSVSPSPTQPVSGGDSGTAAKLEVIPGVDIGMLTDDQQKLYMKLAGSLPSPCGKAHSLLTSGKDDAACKRAPFALRYLRRLMQAEMTEEEAKAIYDLRYGASKIGKVNLENTPVVGSPTAPVKMVEFFDYQCPHCADFAGKLEKVTQKYGNKIGVFYLNFPLEHFGEKSVRAAQAARAAHLQGKFHEMHVKLFENNSKLSDNDLLGYAKDIGLDVQKFKDDMNLPATKARIEADKKQGENVGVNATPTLYFNGREYQDPKEAADLSDWIDEELAQASGAP